MLTVDLSEAEPRRTRLVERALAGEEVVIARDGKPAVRLVPVEEAEQAVAKPARERVFGTLRGKGWAAPDAWEPMSEDIDDQKSAGKEASARRRFGLLAGTVPTEVVDALLQPLPEEIIDAFYGHQPGSSEPSGLDDLERERDVR